MGLGLRPGNSSIHPVALPGKLPTSLNIRPLPTKSRTFWSLEQVRGRWNRVRIRWPLFAVLILVALLVVAIVLSTVRSSKQLDPASDPVKVAAAQQLVANLPPPSGASRDLKVGACGQPAGVLAYCITDPAVSPDTLLARVVAQIEVRGGVLSAEVCDAPASTESTYSCHAQMSYNGVPLTVLSSGTVTSGQKEPTTLLVRM